LPTSQAHCTIGQPTSPFPPPSPPPGLLLPPALRGVCDTRTRSLPHHADECACEDCCCRDHEGHEGAVGGVRVEKELLDEGRRRKSLLEALERNKFP